MRKRILFGFLVLGLASIPSLYAQFDSGSTGEDGPFNPTPSTQMPIRCPEPDCVFNFTTVNIPTGVTVKFAPNRFNTPVTILAQGDVMIAGTIDITGSDGLGGSGGAGGPGGFRGGDGGRPGTAIADRMGGSGLGPGGGLTVPSPDFCWEGGGSIRQTQ